jgi:hypothetical protein
MATLLATEILADTLDAFRADVPQIAAFSTDLSSAKAVKGSQIIAHISVLPTVSTYDAVTGFGNGATDAAALLQDVPVTMNQLPQVPTNVTYLDNVASMKDLYEEAIRNSAYVLGKNIIDTILTGVSLANFSNTVTQNIAGTSVSTLESIRSQLNTQHAAPMGRFGIMSTPAAESLQDDQRMMNALFYGNLSASTAYRNYKGVCGFENIWEYPDMPANGMALSGFFGDRRAVTIATRIPDLSAFAGVFPNIPELAKWEVVEDPNSGLAILGISWMTLGTFTANFAMTFLYGYTMGNQGAGAGQKTDNAGVLLKTA